MEDKINKIIKIQKIFRGYIERAKRMPIIIYVIKKYLEIEKVKLTKYHEDGRINSSIDENEVINILIKKFDERIIKPNNRIWYDILVNDYKYGWIPINIKITTMTTSDNIGNLATCVYALTDEKLELKRNKTYENGLMSEILFNKLKRKEYNRKNKKDYYFVVLNKIKTDEIIINSIKGLSILTTNINNLPFQICWNKNKKFKYDNINIKIKLFIDCIQKSKPSWKEKFLKNMRTLKL